MFIEFQFGNFRSFRDITILSMQAAPQRSNDYGEHEENVYEAGGMRMLKCKAVYGANASGKSNLAKALGLFRMMADQSVTKENLPQTIWLDRFKLAADWDTEPVLFQGIFLIENTFYRYGFEILDKAVISEWLFVRKSSDEKEEELFVRTNITEIRSQKGFLQNGSAFSKLLGENNHELFRSDSLFLTAAALYNLALAKSIRDSIRSISVVTGYDDALTFKAAMEILDVGTESEKEFIKSFLRAADTGIDDLEIIDLPYEFLQQNFPAGLEAKKESNAASLKGLFSSHTVYNDEGEPDSIKKVSFVGWESEGTAKLFGLSALLLFTIREGRTLMIDEFDARFHPNLTLKIVELFRYPDTNPKNAQLIFITHDSSLLERAKLRRDQIAFIQKDKYGISTLTTLIEYKSVRKDASNERDYLQGRYNSVPYLSRMDWAVKEILEEDELSETE